MGLFGGTRYIHVRPPSGQIAFHDEREREDYRELCRDYRRRGDRIKQLEAQVADTVARAERAESLLDRLSRNVVVLPTVTAEVPKPETETL